MPHAETETDPLTAIWRVTIPDFHPVSVNTLLSLSPYRRTRVKLADLAVVTVYLRKADVPKATCRRRLSVTFRGLRGDVSNKLKVLEDCLVAAEVLVDDSPRWLELGEIKAERGKRATILTIEDIEPGKDGTDGR